MKPKRATRTGVATATERDREHLREVWREGGPVHPFTSARFVALGWWEVLSPSGFERPGSYAFTDTGLVVVHTPPSGKPAVTEPR